ncbi:MAG: pyruvate, phosphate dikinase [Chloroflexota bacterium]|nr:pyruvate, phosphate dikinase [Chloroflexota bacterium]
MATRHTTKSKTLAPPARAGVENRKPKIKKWVYLFEQGNKDMRDLLGGKGAGLAEMTGAQLPVPPGFTITTEACNAYVAAGKKFPKGMWEQTLAAMKKVEAKSGKKFGDPKDPLLVSVRSGAKFSMPGMMDTVLNLGLNAETLKGIEALTKNPRFAQDAYRRFIQMFGRIVMGIEAKKFDAIFDGAKEKNHAKMDTDLDANALKEVVAKFKGLYKKEIGTEFPEDPYKQLELAIGAVFGSWMGKRAVDYRRINKIPDNLGTAVSVVTMVFGNMGDDSGTGVAFTRDPATGENELYGEYLTNAQGEDVVAGIRTPMKIAELKDKNPQVYNEFRTIARQMEKHYREMQDLEFTVERGKLYMLQTRTGKRTARAAVKVAVDMVREKLITKEEAVQRLEPNQVVQLLMPQFDMKAKDEGKKKGDLLATGLNASPGAATGLAIFDPDTAEKLGKEGKRVILVRYETSPEDVHGMYASKGILTQHGGATSHAAVVARGAGLPCVAGCEGIRVDEEKKSFTAGGKTIKEGDAISIDGGAGEVFAGQIQTILPDFDKEEDLKLLLSWADDIRMEKSRKALRVVNAPQVGLQVWANADYPRDARMARRFGAQGIGLCRTEHMFFETERLPIVQKMILAKNDAERQKYLDQLLPIQRADFVGIFEAMEELPTVIRLIDPPLHEFLPSYEELLVKATELRVRIEYMEKDNVSNSSEKARLKETEEMLKAVAGMKEANPMLGLRGCRLGITMPQITVMQTRAILEAACTLKKRGVDVHPEIMIPLVGHVNELKNQREILEAEAEKVLAEQGVALEYKFGTMIEVPRGALTAAEIAEYAQFFSFGTNDLTQTTYGYSRDDAEGKFLLKYVEDKILPENPFQALDQAGVGQLMQIAVKQGRATKPNLKIGICGEHGGDPSSIEFCHRIGLNYVSCSPFRVPVARLAAAQAALTPIAKDK